MGERDEFQQACYDLARLYRSDDRSDLERETTELYNSWDHSECDRCGHWFHETDDRWLFSGWNDYKADDRYWEISTICVVCATTTKPDSEPQITEWRNANSRANLLIRYMKKLHGETGHEEYTRYSNECGP